MSYNYQIIIEYVGTNFVGWQIQKNGKSIQEVVQKILSKTFKSKVKITGSGRTDAGVHARGQSANFYLKKKIENKFKLLETMNFYLNKYPITIIDIKKRSRKFHARFSAKKRIYKYIFFNRLTSPLIEKKRAWHVRKKLDIELLKKGAKKLIGTKDFSTFRAASCNAKTPIRTIEKIKIKKFKNKIEIEFKSQSFLQQQVRSMVGCLKYLGEKKWTLKKFDEVIKSRKRASCAPPAPPEGLFLLKVIY